MKEALADNTVSASPAVDHLAWQRRSEAVAEEMPLIRGVRLLRAGEPLPLTWLDRANSYVVHHHALEHDGIPLMMVQPSILVSPLYPLVALLSLSVMDAMTSAQSFVEALTPGWVYEIDGFYCRYCGMSDIEPGWLRLQFRDYTHHSPPAIAQRMRPAPNHRLSKGGGFTSKAKPGSKEPIQRFFDLPDAVGAIGVSKKVLFVTSRRRADALLTQISSNNANLIADGFVGYRGSDSSIAETPLTNPITVVPTIALVRHILESGGEISAVLVDGYERLAHGRHDLPFINAMPRRPAIIVWDFRGYFPSHNLEWIGEYLNVSVCAGELKQLLDADPNPPSGTDELRQSLLLAAAAPRFEERLVGPGPLEQELLDAIDSFIDVTLNSSQLPDYWRYQLRAVAREFKAVVADTPAYWADIRDYARDWTASFKEQWSTLTSRGADILRPLAEAHSRIVALCERDAVEQNAKAGGLLESLKRRPEKDLYFPCEHRGQITIASSFAKRSSCSIRPVLQKHLPVSSDCVVAGWPGHSFARRLWAHTPRSVLAIVDQHQSDRWRDAVQSASECQGRSLLDTLDHRSAEVEDLAATASTTDDAPPGQPDLAMVDPGLFQDRVPCVFVWLCGEANGQIIARHGSVLMEIGDHAANRQACDLAPGDKVVLSSGSGRWSPSDEFTEALVRGIEKSHPELVSDAKAWRRGLYGVLRRLDGSSEQLRLKLKEVGIEREPITVDGWLKLDRAAPIGPQHIEADLTAMWPIIGEDAGASRDAAVSASKKLRALRSTAGRALIRSWKGESIDVGVDREWIADLVSKIREHVEVFEVEHITFGEVPAMLLGWWIPMEMAKQFELEWSGSRKAHTDLIATLDQDDS